MAVNPKLWIIRFQGKSKSGQLFLAEVSLDLLHHAAQNGVDLNNLIAAELAGYDPASYHPVAIAHIEA